MSNLYEINIKFLQAIAKLEAAETEAEYYDAEVQLAAIDCARDEKLEACICYLKNLRARAEPFKAEIARLSVQLESIQNQAERFEKYIRSSIPEGEKWSRGVHSIGWRKSEAVKITDQEAIPSAYLREVLRYEADKTQIKTDLKCGATIPGCELEVRQNLQIR